MTTYGESSSVAILPDSRSQKTFKAFYLNIQVLMVFEIVWRGVGACVCVCGSVRAERTFYFLFKPSRTISLC